MAPLNRELADAVTRSRVENLLEAYRASTTLLQTLGQIFGPQISALQKSGLLDSPEAKTAFDQAKKLSDKVAAIQKLIPEEDVRVALSNIASALRPLDMLFERLREATCSPEVQRLLQEEASFLKSFSQILAQNQELFSRLRSPGALDKLAKDLYEQKCGQMAKPLEKEYSLEDFFDVGPETAPAPDAWPIIFNCLASLYNIWSVLLFAGLVQCTFPTFMAELFNQTHTPIEQTQKYPCISEGPNKRVKIIRTNGKENEKGGNQ